MYDNVSRLILFKKGSSFIHIRRAHVWLISKLGLYGLASFWVKIIIWLSLTNYPLSSWSWLRDQLHIFVAKKMFRVMFRTYCLFQMSQMFCAYGRATCALNGLLTDLADLGRCEHTCEVKKIRTKVRFYKPKTLTKVTSLERGRGLIWTRRKRENLEQGGKGYLKRWGPRLLRRFCWSNISYRCFFGWIFFGRIGSVTILMFLLHLSREGQTKKCIDIWDNYWRMNGAGKGFCPMKSAAQKLWTQIPALLSLLWLEFSNCTSWEGSASKCNCIYIIPVKKPPGMYKTL